MTFPHVGFKDILEIVFIIFILYKVILSTKDTRMWTVFRGIAFLFFLYIPVLLFHLDALAVVFQWIIYWGALALIVIFQSDIRRFLEKTGILLKTVNAKNIFQFIKNIFSGNKSINTYYSTEIINELQKASFAMGKVKTGALIVIERETLLKEFIDTGIKIDGELTSQLLINIFEKNTPLHDGAVVVRNNRVDSATCYLPLTENSSISKSLGTRHRAAIGATEDTDAIVIVVSEETGKVSIVMDGRINYDVKPDTFCTLLTEGAKKEGRLNSQSSSKKSNLKYQMIAVTLGTLSWLVLISVANPVTSKTFYDIPVEIINDSVITDLGQTYEVTSGKTANVTIKDRRDVVDNITNIQLSADMKKLSYVYAMPIEIASQLPETTEVKITGSTTTSIKLEELVELSLPVSTKEVGSIPSGYYINNVSLDNQYINVTIAESLSKTIDDIFIEIPVDSLNNTQTFTLVPKLYDKNGNLIDSNKYTTDIHEITASIETYPTKLVPIELNIQNLTDNDYEIKDMDYYPKNIYIAADEETLSNIDKITIDTNISFSGNAQYTKTIKIDEYLNDDVNLAQTDNRLTLMLSFKELKSMVMSFDSSEISLMGSRAEYTYVIENGGFDFEFKGRPENLEKLEQTSIVPYIDVSGLEPGDYNLMVQFNAMDGIRLANNLNARVRIVEE